MRESSRERGMQKVFLGDQTATSRKKMNDDEELINTTTTGKKGKLMPT